MATPPITSRSKVEMELTAPMFASRRIMAEESKASVITSSSIIKTEFVASSSIASRPIMIRDLTAAVAIRVDGTGNVDSVSVHLYNQALEAAESMLELQGRGMYQAEILSPLPVGQAKANT